MSTPRLVRPHGKESQSLAVDRDGDLALRFEDEDGALLLTPSGLRVRKKPSYGSFENAMAAAVYMAEKAPFWKADLLEYAHKRPDWAGLIDQVIDAGTFTKKTIDQYRYVARAVPVESRVEGLSFSHHEAVASVPDADDKKKLLEQAKREHLSVSDLKKVVRKQKKVKRVMSGQASSLSNLQHKIVEHAHEAAAFCREIPHQDCAQAEKMIEKARRELDRCEDAVAKFRTAQGKA